MWWWLICITWLVDRWAIIRLLNLIGKYLENSRGQQHPNKVCWCGHISADGPRKNQAPYWCIRCFGKGGFYRPRSGEVMHLVASIRPSVCLSALTAFASATKSKEESISVRGVCRCVDLSRGCGRSAFNYSYWWQPFWTAHTVNSYSIHWFNLECKTYQGVCF